MNGSVGLLQDALVGANYRVGEVEDGRAFLAENPERVVWTVVFETMNELLASWHEAQVHAIARTESLAPEKSWELYLLLATELEPSEDGEVDLNEIRRDTSYARKVLVPGLAVLTTSEIETYLAPLRALKVSPVERGPDALAQLGRAVEDGGDPAEAAVLKAFEANRPLFEGL